MAETLEYIGLIKNLTGDGPLPPGWVPLPIPPEKATNPDTGFLGGAYANTNGTGEIVIVYGPTSLLDGGDLKNDSQIANGQLPSQYGDALNLYNYVHNTYGTPETTTYTVTGNSLGGALGELVAKKTDGSAVTFGAPGVDNIPLPGALGPGTVTNYVLGNDPVGNYGPHVGTVVHVGPQSDPDLYQELLDLCSVGVGACIPIASYLVWKYHAIERYREFFTLAPQTGSPIILDLDGDGVETIAVADGPNFDHDGNGFAEQTGWVGADDGLLVRDLNGNGTIDDGKELFGDQTLLQDGTRAANGYQALAELDSNADGKINASDPIYSQLRIWRDTNSDGVSESGELFTLPDQGVASINTGYTTSTYIDPNGNEHRQVSSFTRTDNTTGATADAWFKLDKTFTIATDWLDVPADVAALPNAQGFGNVYDLHQAMVRDTSGALKSLVENFVAQTDPAQRSALMDQLLFTWTDSGGIDPTSRGPEVDACKLGVLEKFYAPC